MALLGSLGLIVGTIMILVRLIRKKPAKPALILLGISFILFVGGLSKSSNTPPPAESKKPVQNAEQSKERFAKGVEHFNNKEYEKAISLFEEVIEEDKENYQKAQDYIKEAKTLLSQELMADAKNNFDKENYKEAINAAQKAIALNAGIKDEADPIIKEATEKNVIQNMKTWEGTGKARVAVSNVIAKSSFNDGFTTWKPEDPENTCFLLVGVGVYNASSSTLHVNPNYVTLICNNQVFNPDINTYSMDNYLDAIDLQPGTYTTGWLLFLVPKAEAYTLIYEGMFDTTISKEIIITERK